MTPSLSPAPGSARTYSATATHRAQPAPPRDPSMPPGYVGPSTGGGTVQGNAAGRPGGPSSPPGGGSSPAPTGAAGGAASNTAGSGTTLSLDASGGSGGSPVIPTTDSGGLSNPGGTNFWVIAGVAIGALALIWGHK